MTWESLTDNMPDFINLGGAATVLAELEAIEEPDEDQQERLESMRALREALEADWDSATDYGHPETLHSEDNWREYQEEQAYDSGDIEEHSTVADYVDWDAYAEAMKESYRTVEVESGEFAGTWYLKEK